MYRYGNFVFKILLITSLYALCKLRVFLLTQHAHLFLTFQKKKKCKRTSEGRTVEWFDKVKNKQTNQKSSPSSCSGKSRFPHCRACWNPEPSRTPQPRCSPPTCPPHALEEASQCPGTPAHVCPWTLRLRRRSATALWGRQPPRACRRADGRQSERSSRQNPRPKHWLGVRLGCDFMPQEAESSPAHLSISEARREL